MTKFRSAKFGRILTAALSAVMVSESAFALSCVRPDLLRSLEQAKSSPTVYYILVGKFESNGIGARYIGKSAPQDQFRQSQPVITQSLFEGVSLGANRRDDQVLSRYPVHIETRCTGPWCSSVPASNQDLIAFVEARPGQAPILRLSPCPGQTFRAVPERVQKIRQCLTQSCPPDKPNGAFTR